MPEPHKEEKQDNDLPPQEQEELEAFREALKKHGSKDHPPEEFFEELRQEVRRRYPESSPEVRGAIERLREERERNDSGRKK